MRKASLNGQQMFGFADICEEQHVTPLPEVSSAEQELHTVMEKEISKGFLQRFLRRVHTWGNPEQQQRAASILTDMCQMTHCQIARAIWDLDIHSDQVTPNSSFAITLRSIGSAYRAVLEEDNNSLLPGQKR